MGRFADPDAPCVCGHFVADHAWNDPLMRTASESASAYSIRFGQASKEMMEQRNEEQLNRTKCHVKACSCIDYQERKVA